MNKEIIILTQKLLKSQDLYSGKIDGLLGPKTLEALRKTGIYPKSWNENRILVGFLQKQCAEHDIDYGTFDGYWGPQTEAATSALQEKLGLDEGFFRRPGDFSPSIKSLDWPTQFSDKFYEIFGQPGENLTSLEIPYPMKLSWAQETIVNKITCHKAVAKSLSTVLNNVLKIYGKEKISKLKLDLFGGCYNFRKMRGGEKLSMHSWGIALDFCPDENRLRWGRTKALFAKKEYNDWWDCWEEEGWTSLGRMRNFDWMHVQAPRI